MTASAVIRRRPSSAFESGNCARTITSVLTKKISPMPFSVTPASFLAKTGSSSNCA